MARRRLNLSADEWDALPWWLQRTYFEGYEWEGLIERTTGSTDPTVVSTEVHRSGGTTITDSKHHATFDGTPGEFVTFGIQEQWIG